MITWGQSDFLDYKKWLKCVNIVTAEMLREGWNKHARKFSQVCKRRARKLYYK